MTDENTENFFCDARRLLHSAPTGERIERDARELLSRSLTLRPPIAFVGAGASMAYGRISWRDAVIAMQDHVLQRADELLRGSKSAPLQDLYALARQVQIKPDRQGDSRDYLIVFQLVEQLDRAIQHLEPEAPAETFRSRLKALLRNDVGHMNHILDTALRKSEYERKPLRPERRQSDGDQDIRSSAFFKEMSARIRSELGGDSWRGEILKCFEQFSVTPGKYLRPYHRFAIGAALELVAPGCRPRCLDLTVNPQTGRYPVWSASEQLTAKDLPPERDPIQLLRACHISRFLTTNYDNEIDHRLTAEGLVRDDHERGEETTRDLLAHRWRRLVFNRHNVGQMLAFAAREGRRFAEVVHLHGLAHEGHDIIVTNEDYQKHYLSIDDRRAGMEHALAAAFGGNTLLFVGSGMGEDDLLRPLRQFVGDPAPGSRRTAIAIVPADWLADDSIYDLQKLGNLQRYGVYTIHVGNAQFNKASDTEKTGIPRRWLTRIAELRRRLDAVLRSKDPLDACEKVADWLVEAFGKHKDKLSMQEHRDLAKPDWLENISVEEFPGLDLSAELGVFNCALGIVQAIHSNRGRRPKTYEGNEQEAWSKALQLALQGCMDSIVGAFLCARLIRMRRDTDDYVDRWYEPPIPRNPILGVRRALEQLKPTSLTNAVWVRHSVALAEKDQAGKDWQRFYAGAPSQTFMQLRDSLHHPDMKRILCEPPNARRIFLFIARRGTGKGHFTAALSSAERLDQLRNALGNAETEPSKRWPAAFFTCGVSHEVTSIFDQLGEVLLQSVSLILRGLEASDKDPRCVGLARLFKEADELMHDRIGRLRRILLGIGDLGLQPKQRIIIVLSGLSILFDREGRCKNAQAERLFNLLTGDASARVPMDLIVISGEQRLPRIFRSKQALPPLRDGKFPEPKPLHELVPLNLSPSRQEELVQRRAAVAVAPTQAMPASQSDQAYVHFLSPARASIMLTAYFPSVALVMALAELDKLVKGSADVSKLGWEHKPSIGRVNPLQFERTKAGSIVRRISRVLDGASSGAGPKELFPEILAWAAWYAAQGKIWQEHLFSGEEGKWTLALPAVSDEQQAVLSLIRHAVDEQMKALFVACGNSRYGLTVLASTAYQELLKAADQLKPDEEKYEIKTVIDKCTKFLRDSQVDLRGQPDTRRVPRIFEIIMAKLDELDHDTSRSLPGNFTFLRGHSELFNFQRAILLQLAIIGQPVVADVIARAPPVLRFYTKLREPADKWGPDQWIKVVEECLTLLFERCLVFKIRPFEPNQREEPRYAIQGQLQRYLFRRLHASIVEYPEADQFALTLFASQPNDVPRLTAEARDEIYATVAALSGYPGTRNVLESFPAWPSLEGFEGDERDAKLVIRSGLLRAVLGIIRSVYSLSTIARAAPGSATEVAERSQVTTEEDGILQRHRDLVHWIILQAANHDRLKQGSGKKIPSPFFAEEIAWLYNEAGVLSYAQGALQFARGFFNRAAEFAHRIEPSQTGAIRSTIALNVAETDIDRGRLMYAEAAIATILGIKDEHPVVLRVAAGLMGLVEQIKGRYPSAERYFKQALDDSTEDEEGSPRLGLITLKQTRAASIMSRHYAELLQRVEGRMKEARAMLRQSAILAIEGGHEDIRYQSRLSYLRLKLMEREKDGKVATDGHNMHKELDVIEDFARVMGMPRLQCAADEIRARLHLADGDLQAALAMASRGLTLASANDLRLRKTLLLLRLAQIFERRGEFNECRAVLAEAFDLARETGYHAAVEEGQELHARISKKGRDSDSGGSIRSAR